MTQTLEEKAEKALTEFRSLRTKAQAIYDANKAEFERDHNKEYVCIADINSDKPQFYFAKTADDASYLARREHPQGIIYNRGINTPPEPGYYALTPFFVKPPEKSLWQTLLSNLPRR